MKSVHAMCILQSLFYFKFLITAHLVCSRRLEEKERWIERLEASKTRVERAAEIAAEDLDLQVPGSGAGVGREAERQGGMLILKSFQNGIFF